MNNSIIYILIIIAVGILIFSIWVRRPLKTTLDRLKPNRVFGGLIRFGKEGAYIKFDQKPAGDRVSFIKRFREEDNDWFLEVIVSGHNVTASLSNKVKLGLEALKNQFNIEISSSEDSCQVGFFLDGPGLRNRDALEAVLRLLLRHLGHPKNAKYQVDFLGPTDHKAVDKYYSDLLKQWRGR